MQTDKHDLTEAAMLGGVIWGQHHLSVARQYVDADMFRRDAHRDVWEALCRLSDQDVDTGPLELIDELGRAGKLDHIGGAVAVHDLVSDAQPANVEHHAQRVVADHRARLLWRASRDAQTRLAAGDDVDEVLTDLTVAPGRPSGAGSFRPPSLLDRMRRRWEVQEDKWTTGWPHVDEVWRPAAETLAVITGIPGAGKSTWIDQVALWQVEAGRKVAIWSPEQAPAEVHMERLMWSWTGRHPRDMSAVEVDDLAGKWDGLLTFLDPDDNGFESIMARAAALQPDVLLVDPWNKIAHRYGDRRQDLYLQDRLARLTRFARSSGASVWVVAHPTKMNRRNGSMNHEVPTAYDISGGAEWFNQADVVVTLTRDASGESAPPSEVSVVVQKVRREEWGRVGSKRLFFDKAKRGYAANPSITEGTPV